MILNAQLHSGFCHSILVCLLVNEFAHMPAILSSGSESATSVIESICRSPNNTLKGETKK